MDLLDNFYQTLTSVPVLRKPDQSVEPKKYFLYQLNMCFISMHQGHRDKTTEILKYLMVLARSNNIVSSNGDVLDESERFIDEEQEREHLTSAYKDYTDERTKAYELYRTNPEEYEKFTQRRKQRLASIECASPSPRPQSIKRRRYTDYEDSPKRVRYTPAPATPTPMHTPQYDSIPTPRGPIQTPQYAPIVTPAHSLPPTPRPMASPPHVSPLRFEDVTPTPMPSTPCDRNFTPRPHIDDIEKQLSIITNQIDPPPTPRPATPASSSSSLRKRSAADDDSDSSDDEGVIDPLPVYRAAKRSRRVGSTSKCKSIAFYFKDKDVINCVTGNLSYLRSKLRKVNNSFIDPMIIQDGTNFNKVWPELCKMITNQFYFVKKSNKTLTIRNVSQDKLNSVQTFITEKLNAMNFNFV
ncbi:hypothetical protein SlGVgp022 [Spodoptera litura granulovirus]|uniref:Uncharacterized protein n=1 Tax=Spodoptera litura granulovirus TaxID=359919 RepID=A5IZM4_9BBAC|nr:hypothetical protein SlGVgp022 [Spodoptera litura granulovirus]ABQ51965.1 hypothetical protein SlGVgp022 [Spodoptera litura granulovirus]